MGVTLVEFFNNDTEVYYLNDIEKELLRHFRTLTEKQTAYAVLELIKEINISK